MMKDLQANFEEMRYGIMRETLDAIEESFQLFGIDFYLIGAFARDMWMNHLEYLPVRRATLDIDFSIYINDHNQFRELKRYLVQNKQFKEDSEPYRLYSASNQIIDLIPFGGIENNSMVDLDGNPPISLSVFGNAQVLSHASNVKSNNGNFKICTLPGLCILKLVAGDEKPERRPKDFADFFYILENYFEIAGETLFDAAYEDLIEEDFQPAIVSAKILGRQIKDIINDQLELKERIIKVIEKFKEGFDDNEIDAMYNYDKKDAKIFRFKLISSLVAEI